MNPVRLLRRHEHPVLEALGAPEMNWLMEHSIANMYGPHFLVFYGVLILLTLAICWLLLQRHGKWNVASRDDFKVDFPEVAGHGGWPVRLAGAAVIAGVGAYKLLIALARGRHNVGFLLIMGVVALCILFTMSPPPCEGPRDG